MKIEIREIKYGTEEYELEVALRDKILRKPLGLKFSKEQLAKESKDTHFGAFANNKLFGCLVLTPHTETTVKMRQVAVDSDVQGTGIGRQLVAECEAKAKKMGFTEIILSARDTAVPFYLKLGYEIVGEPFVEVNIPHRKMRKR